MGFQFSKSGIARAVGILLPSVARNNRDRLESYPFKRSVRLLGVTLSSLTNERSGAEDDLEPQLDFKL